MDKFYCLRNEEYKQYDERNSPESDVGKEHLHSFYARKGTKRLHIITRYI